MGGEFFGLSVRPFHTHCCRTPGVVTDEGSRVIAVLAPPPEDAPGCKEEDTWGVGVVKAATEAMEQIRKSLVFNHRELHHRQGDYACINGGALHGGGRQLPGNILNPPEQAAAFNHLTSQRCFKRVAGHHDRILSHYAPRLYKCYHMTMNAIYQHHPHLKRIFPSSAWPAATFNLGPRLVTKQHVNSGNYAAGVCPITAFGVYDHTKGGHFVLWDMGLIIEFPPGSTIVVPSGTLLHGNTAIQPHECCYSFTQYAAGALFRWFDYGFRSSKKLSEEDPALFAEMEHHRLTRWAESLTMFSKLEELSMSSS
ncbi:hypothetical protein JAAARDRAFT_118799 [Jaapia argillacea MUCL 33604]|uniref:2OGFeDO JBP1/TET oxygenase domain-containing protein n=1 Tax=Jaapia argillacea MUCL 33604 TaxID=933084 RepID=A0A067QNP4_9AGAM|nr:hypothetical protein JAAARDRAFT_118799 [Jaapia argillacea MUCL 33604]